MLEISFIRHNLRRFMWVCSAAYTILLKYAGIAAVHILFMIANISALCAMQLAVTERL